jgi:hypothetical protein
VASRVSFQPGAGYHPVCGVEFLNSIESLAH